MSKIERRSKKAERVVGVNEEEPVYLSGAGGTTLDAAGRGVRLP